MRWIAAAWFAANLLALAPHAVAQAPAGASMIDCAKAKAADEKAVCASFDLGRLDARMATQYDMLRGFLAMGGRGALIDDQRAWIAQRAKCGAQSACLKRVYDVRIAALQAGLDRVKTFGPF